MKQGMVIYSDGGCRPNPGFGGWGIHGYLYSTDEPKKGSGNANHVLTAEGYFHKSLYAERTAKKNAPPQITPIHYVDGFGSFACSVTNNIGEIVAATQALDHASKYAVETITILTDSEHVIKGVTEWMTGWKRNNWLKSDRTVPANVEYWQELDKQVSALEARNVRINFCWIEGHEGFLGNTRADHLATVGVLHSRIGRVVSIVDTATAEGYWKYTPERHPFIANRRMYFNTMPEFLVPGHYYLGEHGTDDDLLGKRIADGAYSYVVLDEPDPALELVRNQQSNIAGGIDALILARLDYLYSPDVHREFTTYQEFAFYQGKSNRLDMFGLDKEPLTRELRPPKIAIRAIEALSELASHLDGYLEGQAGYVATDVTSSIYEIKEVTKKNKETSFTYKLKPEFVVGFSSFPVEVNYQTNGSAAQAPITVTLGLDMPERNNLKRLEDFQPKIEIITWKESDQAFRYATVITTEKDRGIWASVHSNLRVLPKS